MIKEVEQLVKIIGKGNLLEFLFIFLGTFQNASLNGAVERMDHRNHYDLFAFTQKSQKSKEPLDNYFSLKLSLQGLFLIYTKAYQILNENDELSTQAVIDKIYEIIEKSDLWKYEYYEYNKKSKLDLLNIFANPLGELVFNVEKDFEYKVLIEVKKLLRNANTISNRYDREFALCKSVIDCFYSIHQNIKLDKSIALLLSIGDGYHELSKYNKKLIKKESLPIVVDNMLLTYTMRLAVMLQTICLLNKDKYTLYYQEIGRQNRTPSTIIPMVSSGGSEGFICPKNIGLILEQLLKNQDSNKFEKSVTNPKNIHYSAPQEENKYVLNTSHKKEEKYTKYKNTTCRLILGAFVLSAGLCIINYLFMAQKLPQAIKNVLPQDNFTNLVIFTILTAIMVLALSQLYKLQTPEPAISFVAINDGNLQASYLPLT